MIHRNRFFHAALLAVVLAGCAAPASAPAPQEPPSTAPAGPNRLVYSDDGLSEVAAPPAWQVRPNLSQGADLRLSNEDADNYLLVNTYLLDDTNNLSFEEVSRRINGALLGNITDGKMSEARMIKLGDRPAIEHELRGTVGKLELVYYSVMVDGKRGRYHIVGWAPAAADASSLREVIKSFRESAKPRKAIQRVSLNFKWPDRVNAKASFKHQTSDRHGGFEMVGEYQLNAQASAQEEILISTRMTRQTIKTRLAAKDAGKDDFLQNLLKQASSNLPDYVVNREGEFVRIENLDAYHQRMKEAILKGLPVVNDEASARVEQMVGKIFTVETLAVAMQDDWSTSVEQWAGGSYAPGERYEFVQPYQTAVTGEQVFPMVTTQQLVGRVPCHPNAAQRSCVRMKQTARVSAPSYTAAMDAYVRKTLGQGVRVTKVEVVKTVELITDPTTMLPYFTHKKEVKQVTVEADGKQQSEEDIDETEISYRY